MTVSVFIVAGYFFGKAKERGHYRSIRVREDGFLVKPAATPIDRSPTGK